VNRTFSRKLLEEFVEEFNIRLYKTQERREGFALAFSQGIRVEV
jgi:hypothetical protein